jgi:DNA-binding transcriptional regulator YhcF (GntR family)
MPDSSLAIFEQVAESIAESIINGALPEESRAPSTTELAAFFHINPATAAKGVAQLTEQGIVYKKRGLGMFVAPGAREALLEQRRGQFPSRYIDPMLAEAERIGIGGEELAALVLAHASRATRKEARP